MNLRRNKKDVCDEDVLAAMLIENINQALLWAVVFGEKEINHLNKWLERVSPKTFSELKFVERVKQIVSRADEGTWKIIKIPIYPTMNIRTYSDSDGLISWGFPIEKLEAIVKKYFSDNLQIAELATYDQVSLLKAYKVSTNAVSLRELCESGIKVDNPREFYRIDEKIVFSGGKNWSIADYQIFKEPMLTIKRYDYLVVAVKNK